MAERFVVRSWHFHWRFWKPKGCIGGPVYIGWWGVVRGPGYSSSDQSASQIRVKKSMGMIE